MEEILYEREREFWFFVLREVGVVILRSLNMTLMLTSNGTFGTFETPSPHNLKRKSDTLSPSPNSPTTERPTATSPPATVMIEATSPDAEQEERKLDASTQPTNYPPTIERPTATSLPAAGKGAEEQGAKPETPVTTAQQEESEPEPMETSTLKPASWASMSKKARIYWLKRNTPEKAGGDVTA